MEWRISDGLIDYDQAVQAMEARVVAIRAGQAEELVWLLQHPPLYTAGTSAKDTDLLQPDRLPVYRTGRGGQYTISSKQGWRGFPRRLSFFAPY